MILSKMKFMRFAALYKYIPLAPIEIKREPILQGIGEQTFPEFYKSNQHAKDVT